MKKDEESLLRMNFLIQAARLYENSFPELASHFLYDFVQISEKKIIRMYSSHDLEIRLSRRRSINAGSG